MTLTGKTDMLGEEYVSVTLGQYVSVTLGQYVPVTLFNHRHHIDYSKNGSDPSLSEATD